MTYVDDILPEELDAPVVQWMEPRPSRFRPNPPTITAFALGIAAAIAGYALFQYLAPRREALPPWRWGRGPLH